MCVTSMTPQTWRGSSAATGAAISAMNMTWRFRRPCCGRAGCRSRSENVAGRTLVIGDIHGCLAALVALLDMIQPGPADTLITLGDYIDRGPHSRGVLDRLITLAWHCRLIALL